MSDIRLNRLMRRVSIEPDGCWIWCGSVRSGGYGQIRIGGQLFATHRLSYELHRGPIPEGMHLDHLCHGRDASCRDGDGCLHRRCLNPDHLEVVTPGENVRRGRGNGAKTHCPAGHPYDSPDTLLNAHGRRICRVCRRARTRAKYASDSEYRERVKAYVREWKKSRAGSSPG